MITEQEMSWGVEKVANMICHAGQFCVLALHQIMMQKIWQPILPRARVEKKRSSQSLTKEQKVPELCVGEYCNVAWTQDINSLASNSTKRPCSNCQIIAGTKRREIILGSKKFSSLVKSQKIVSLDGRSMACNISQQ